MERLFELVNQNFESDLKSNFEDIMKQNNIPFLAEEKSKQCYVTFFASNQDINLPKKERTKYRLNHPKLKLSYSLKRFPDFGEVKNTLNTCKDGTEAAQILDISSFIIFGKELKSKWVAEITNRVKSWINTIFAKIMLMYKEHYSITLRLFTIEMYIESPEKMYITKLPKFQDLIFVTSEKPYTVIDNCEIINRQVELIKNSSFFKGKI